MKTKLNLLLLAPLLFSCSGETTTMDDSKQVDVIIISGQSNGVGCTKSEELMTTMGDEKYLEYRAGYRGIQIAYDCWTKDWPASGITFFSQNSSANGEFVKTALGQGNGYATFGPEIGIADYLHEEYDGRLFLIKFACGGSNLKDDWLGGNSPMYGRMINFVKAQMNNLVKKGYSPTIKAFCWMQGEGDSYRGYYNYYLENLRQFVGDIRADLRDLAGGTDIPFIDAGISNASVWEFYREVNDAKKEFAKESENNIFIDTIEEGLHTDQEPWYQPDIYHYDSDSEILLGKLFAQNFEQFLLKKQ